MPLPMVRPALRRSLALVLLVALAATSAAHAAVTFKGFPKRREAALRGDLARSVFPLSSLLNVTVRPRDLEFGALGLAGSNRTIYLDPVVFADDRLRTFAFLHELGHQIDFQLLRDAERGRFYEAAGFGPASDVHGFADLDWYDGKLEHGQIPAEQWASAVPLVVWPAARGNIFLGADGSCIGWEDGEGCAAPLPLVREILNAVLARRGLPPLGDVSGPAGTARESYVPPRAPAPAERALRPPDPGVTPIPTSLATVTALAPVTSARESVLRIRLSGPAGGLPGAPVLLDYQDAAGWWQLAELRTDGAGEIAYRFRPKGWKPLAFRVTFVGASSLTGSTLVVPVSSKS